MEAYCLHKEKTDWKTGAHCTLLLGRIFKINYLYTTGVYRGFFKGAGWFLAVAESMCHAPEMLQLVNCNLIISCFTRNLRHFMPQSRNYEVPFKRVLYISIIILSPIQPRPLKSTLACTNQDSLSQSLYEVSDQMNLEGILHWTGKLSSTGHHTLQSRKVWENSWLGPRLWHYYTRKIKELQLIYGKTYSRKWRKDGLRILFVMHWVQTEACFINAILFYGWVNYIEAFILFADHHFKLFFVTGSKVVLLTMCQHYKKLYSRWCDTWSVKTKSCYSCWFWNNFSHQNMTVSVIFFILV